MRTLTFFTNSVTSVPNSGGTALRDTRSSTNAAEKNEDEEDEEDEEDGRRRHETYQENREIDATDHN